MEKLSHILSISFAFYSLLWYNKCKRHIGTVDAQEVQEECSMTEQAMEARRAYKRKWARENRDKIREQQARYWQRKAEAQEQEPAKEPAPAQE